jgi:hypothetical protein
MTRTKDVPQAKQNDVQPVEASHTWDDLAQLIGTPSDDDHELFQVRSPLADLVEMGTRITSSRVTTDLLRWLGIVHDFTSVATDEQMSHLVGYCPALAQVALKEGLALRDLQARSSDLKGSHGTVRSGDIQAAQTDREVALQRKEQLYGALHAAWNDDLKNLGKLNQAYGTSSDSQALSSSLKNLAELGIGILSDPKSRAAARLAKANINRKYFDDTITLAAQVKASAERGSGPQASTGVTQSECDLQDGICLTLMQTMHTIFEAGHLVDPRIPRLLPIATRHFFYHPKKKHEATTPAPQPAQSGI